MIMQAQAKCYKTPPDWVHLACVGHTRLLKGNVLMRQAALQRLAICCSDERIPDYIEHKVCDALEALVRQEQDDSVRRALYECIAAFAGSPWRRQLLLEAGVCKALEDKVGEVAEQEQEQLGRLMRACTHQ
jgi:hypothetical protein